MRTLLLAAVLLAAPAFADKKEEAQKKMDEAAAKACQIAKDAIAKQEACADENEKMSAVTCSDKDSRKSADYMKLNKDCMQKVKAAAKKK